MAIDPLRLRNVFGHFATGVAVVTTVSDEGERAGLTINSFNSVSLTPELVQFSLDKKVRSLPVFRRSRHYVINFLSEEQGETSARFARGNHDKWAGCLTRLGLNGAPILEGCLAYIDCEREQVLALGDHEVFFCRVLDFASDSTKAPLVFFKGRYCALTPSTI